MSKNGRLLRFLQRIMYNACERTGSALCFTTACLHGLTTIDRAVTQTLNVRYVFDYSIQEIQRSIKIKKNTFSS